VDFQQLFDRLKQLQSKLSTQQLISLIVAFVAVVGLIASASWYISAPEYRLLLTDMDPEEASQVVSKLTAEKVTYRLANGGRDVEVPKEDLDRLRLSFSSEGMPGSGRIGFEIFDRTAFGQTEFLEQVNYRRALEGEIARTIATISEVGSARVHIAMAKDSLFGSRMQPAKASVVLKLKRNRPLAAGTIAGISNLVASSVEGLRPENVVLIDSFGRPLSRPTDENADEPLSGAQMERQQRLERDMATRVVSMLEPVVGQDRVRVNVSARLNSNTEEQTEEHFDPTTPVIRSKQTTLDGTTNGAASGVAGARGNVPGPAPPTPAGEPSKATAPPATATTATTSASRSAEIVNYEISKTVKHTVKPRGDIARLSVAVILDDDHVIAKDPQGKMTQSVKPRNPAELQKIQQIVAAAVGLDTTRGDLLTVENIAFDEVPVDIVEPTWVEKLGPGLRDTGKIVAVIALCLFAFLFVLRPMVRRALALAPMEVTVSGPTQLSAAASPGSPKMPQQLPRTIAEVENEIENQLDAAAAEHLADRRMPVLQRRVVSMAQAEPQNAARLVRSWLAEERN
jgi:flagellar M-ring protein FliF